MTLTIDYWLPIDPSFMKAPEKPKKLWACGNSLIQILELEQVWMLGRHQQSLPKIRKKWLVVSHEDVETSHFEKEFRDPQMQIPKNKPARSDQPILFCLLYSMLGFALYLKWFGSLSFSLQISHRKDHVKAYVPLCLLLATGVHRAQDQNRTKSLES